MTGDQIPLLRDGPTARRTDPGSSRQAGAENISSGRRLTQQQQVLRLVLRHTGRTSRELASLGNIDRYCVGRRLPELARAGDIERGDEANGGMKVCTVTGKRAVTWWPAGADCPEPNREETS